MSSAWLYRGLWLREFMLGTSKQALNVSAISFIKTYDISEVVAYIFVRTLAGTPSE